jgi:hypothetical protein
METETTHGASTVRNFCSRHQMSRTTFYREVARKRLRAVKRGAATIILKADEDRYIAGLPELTSTMGA